MCSPTSSLREGSSPTSATSIRNRPLRFVRARIRSTRRSLRLYAKTRTPRFNLIGHSTGGLDARLFVSPSVNLLRETEGVGALAERVKSVVTVSTPHLGTPLAFFFNNILGQNLLYVLSMGTIYALRFGRFPLSTLFSIIGVIARLDDRLGWRNTIVDQFYENLLADFDDPQRIVEISEYLEAIRTDQTLLGQLTPGGLDLLNATAQDRKGVRYGCVMTRGKRPSLESFKNIGLDPYRHASHMVYRFLYKLTSFVPDYPSINPIHRAFLEREYGDLPETDASDGIVPTWSQLHGTPIHATWADHLDVCGHFREQESHEPPHVDWLSSGSNFNRRKFEALWADVASFICDEM